MKQPAKPEIDHRTIKLLIGLIAITLPILTNAFASAPLESISASFYEQAPAQTIFVGFLFAIAAFLAAYNGKSRLEMILSRVSAAAALIAALFPCDCGRETAVPFAHSIAAAIMFIGLAIFCLIFYRRARGKKKAQHNTEAGRRAWVYATSGIVIAGVLVVLGLDNLLDHSLSQSIPRLVFLGEFVCLVAFGISWLTASHVVPLLAQKDERPPFLAKQPIAARQQPMSITSIST